MGLYKRILLTLDCSPVDDVIVPHICGLAKIHGSQVFLIHVVHSHTLDQDRVLHEQTSAFMAEKEKIFKAQGIPVKVIIRSGEPDQELMEELDNNDYDLIAMATHGHSFFMDLLFGSISDRLKHKTNIPLLLIKA